MAVYVDDMRVPFGRLIMCHMIADTDRELREMAEKIGVNQRWHQGDHFDICLSKRERAVKAGAIEISQRTVGYMSMRRRITGFFGSPDNAEQWFNEHRANKKAVTHG